MDAVQQPTQSCQESESALAFGSKPEAGRGLQLMTSFGQAVPVQCKALNSCLTPDLLLPRVLKSGSGHDAGSGFGPYKVQACRVLEPVILHWLICRRAHADKAKDGLVLPNFQLH